MKIDIVAVGKIKEQYIKDGIADYSKRLSRFIKLNIVELDDEPLFKDENKVKDREGQRILKYLSALPPNAYIIALDLKGGKISSEDMAKKINGLTVKGISHIVFIIGGSIGLSGEVLQRSDFLLNCSSFTFPHNLMRLILLEQIYRWFKIMSGETYHK